MTKKSEDTSLLIIYKDNDEEAVEIKFQHREPGYERLVHFTETALLIAHIKRWVELYRKEIIPNFEQVESPTVHTLTKEQKVSRLNEMKDYVSAWDDRLPKLIPENTWQHKSQDLYYVYKNYILLEPNKALTYNQALFILLGLNAYELDFSCIDLPVFDDRPTGESSVIENLFWNTRQNQELRQSAYVQHGKITSINLRKLAEANDFFQKDTWIFPDNKSWSNKNKGISIKETRKKRDNRKKIETIAQDIKKDAPEIANYLLAEEVSELMMEYYGIKLSPETIRTGYSGSLKKS